VTKQLQDFNFSISFYVLHCPWSLLSLYIVKHRFEICFNCSYASNKGTKLIVFVRFHLTHLMFVWKHNQGIAESVGNWFFDRVSVHAIGCPYPCDKTCHNLVFKWSLLKFHSFNSLFLLLHCTSYWDLKKKDIARIILVAINYNIHSCKTLAELIKFSSNFFQVDIQVPLSGTFCWDFGVLKI